MVYRHNGILLYHKIEWNPVIYNMDGTEYYVKWNKPGTERQFCMFSLICGSYKKKMNSWREAVEWWLPEAGKSSGDRRIKKSWLMGTKRQKE